MEGGNCFIYVFQIKWIFFFPLCFYFSKTCSCLNLDELGSEIQFWNGKFKLYKKPLWRPDGLISYSLELTLSNLLKQSCSQSFQLESLLAWAEKKGPFLYQTLEEHQDLGVWGTVQNFCCIWLCRGSAPRVTLAALGGVAGMVLLCPVGLPYVDRMWKGGSTWSSLDSESPFASAPSCVMTY